MQLDEALRSLPEKDLINFGDYVEGKIPTPTEAQNAVNTWKQISKEIADKSQEFGIEIKLPNGTKIPFSPRENYYPYVVKDDKLKEILKDQNKYNAFLEQVASESKITVAKAHELISDMINGRAGVEGHLERARLAKLPKEFYERDPRKVLQGYVSSAYSRLGDAKEFAGNDEILQNLIEKARVSGEDFEEIQSLVNRVLGREKYDETINKVSEFARNYNNYTKLSLAAVTNLGDITKPFIRTNITASLKGIVKAFTKEGKQLAGKAGVVQPMLQKFATEQGLSDKFFKYTGFQATETKLRQIAANSANSYVDMLYKKLVKNPDNVFARRRLEQFGLDADELLSRGIKNSDFIGAAYQAIADMQPVSRVDVPYYWQSPTGKILTQYKTFAYKQMKFAKNFIWDEMKKGNVKPLLSFLVIGTAVGEGVADLKAFVRGRERDSDVSQRIADNLMTIGGVGLITDFMANLQYGTLGGGFLKFVAGPTLSDIDAWITAAQGDINTLASSDKKFVSGDVPQKGEAQPKVFKKMIYSVPIIGPALASKLYPTRNKYKAKVIPIAEEILQLKDEPQQIMNKPKMNKPKMNKPKMNKPQ
jgi:hypothetical protein